jgi:hypothetical protein
LRVILILVAASIFFALPIRGSVLSLLAVLGVFIASNLALGVTFHVRPSLAQVWKRPDMVRIGP